MIDFDPSELDSWAAKPDCQSRFPELVRRLILATVPKASLVDIPSGSSVTEGGWDGRLEVTTGNPWVPDGSSAWEMSCRKDVTTKAKSDYLKRTEKPGGVDRSKATFVFATPRKWNTKAKWVTSLQKKGEWLAIRLLDASDLTQWLQQAPAVADWLARQIGKIPESGVASLVSWWQEWAWQTDPHMTPELVRAGRERQGDQLATWVKGEASQFYLQAETEDEAIAYFASSALASSDEWGSHALSRALVVEDPKAWRDLQNHSLPLILIKAFREDVATSIAVDKGHHVLVPASRVDDVRGSGSAIPRLGRDETGAALVNLGFAILMTLQLAIIYYWIFM